MTWDFALGVPPGWYLYDADPATRTIRVRGLRRSGSGDPDEGDLVMDAVEHWVPVPGHGDVLLLRGSTPCLDIGDELADVFDAIAGTLEFTSVPAIDQR